MVTQAKTDLSRLYIDKGPLQQIVANHHRQADIKHDPDMTPEKVQAMMRTAGIRAEDNLASCGIIAARKEISGENPL